ncbi:Hypothetical_protein [Hexamita inflata]|uniref:Hypothetical_protein n=1 Tax=Hexamita inflata TaxID=28002 RepID=A0AA86UF18_9EUKA|nr:Hypothetical protein HINF_LOCUS25998 [Hexamita inflata]
MVSQQYSERIFISLKLFFIYWVDRRSCPDQKQKDSQHVHEILCYISLLARLLIVDCFNQAFFINSSTILISVFLIYQVKDELNAIFGVKQTGRREQSNFQM